MREKYQPTLAQTEAVRTHRWPSAKEYKRYQLQENADFYIKDHFLSLEDALAKPWVTLEGIATVLLPVPNWQKVSALAEMGEKWRPRHDRHELAQRPALYRYVTELSSFIMDYCGDDLYFKQDWYCEACNSHYLWREMWKSEAAKHHHLTEIVLPKPNVMNYYLDIQAKDATSILGNIYSRQFDAQVLEIGTKLEQKVVAILKKI